MQSMNINYKGFCLSLKRPVRQNKTTLTAHVLYLSFLVLTVVQCTNYNSPIASVITPTRLYFSNEPEQNNTDNIIEKQNNTDSIVETLV